MPSAAARLYHQDFVRWVETQADALRDAARSGTNLPVDWDNLIEEVESLARSERRELKNRLAAILEHLFKLAHSAATGPRPGWESTVRRARLEIERLLEDSPSLKAEIPALIEREEGRAAKLAAKELEAHGELSDAVLARLAGAHHDVDEVLGDYFPDRSHV